MTDLTNVRNADWVLIRDEKDGELRVIETKRIDSYIGECKQYRGKWVEVVRSNSLAELRAMGKLAAGEVERNDPPAVTGVGVEYWYQP